MISSLATRSFVHQCYLLGAEKQSFQHYSIATAGMPTVAINLCHPRYEVNLNRLRLSLSGLDVSLRRVKVKIGSTATRGWFEPGQKLTGGGLRIIILHLGRRHEQPACSRSG